MTKYTELNIAGREMNTPKKVERPCLLMSIQFATNYYTGWNCENPSPAFSDLCDRWRLKAASVDDKVYRVAGQLPSCLN